MNVVDALFAKYRASGRIRANEVLLSHADALRVIQDCEGRGVTILGMDFLKEAGPHITQVNSTDFSSISSQPDSARRTAATARALLRNGLPDGANWVHFVLRGPTRPSGSGASAPGTPARSPDAEATTAAAR